MLVSFAWTTPALLAGEKSMTRRDWAPSHAARFRAGDLVDAWNRSPRAGRSSGARRVATIRVARAPYLQRTSDLGMDDYRREGFLWLREHGHADTVERIAGEWLAEPRMLWVLEFELIAVLGGVA